MYTVFRSSITVTVMFLHNNNKKFRSPSNRSNPSRKRSRKRSEYKFLLSYLCFHSFTIYVCIILYLIFSSHCHNLKRISYAIRHHVFNEFCFQAWVVFFSNCSCILDFIFLMDMSQKYLCFNFTFQFFK